MRCRCLWDCVLSLSVFAVLVSTVAAAEGTNSPGRVTSRGLLQIKDSADDGIMPEDVENAPSRSAKTKAAPTPAKRTSKDSITAREKIASKIQSVSDSNGKPSAAAAPLPDSVAGKPKSKVDEESLLPIPDAMEGGPLNVEAASFKGVTPGVSKKEDVAKAWGEPKKVVDQKEGTVQLYSIEPFDCVEVNYLGNVVSSVIIRFERPYPAQAVAKQLDLATVRPVLVSNELGEVLGLSYPERGVLFAFETSKDSDKPSMKVAQIVLEPITAEPFVLRAETTISSRYDLSRRDLDQALLLEPGNARAHWLQSRVLVSMDSPEKAATEAAEAVKLDPNNPHYRVTRSQVLAQLGRLPEAIEEAKKAVDASGQRPHVKARALCLIGDLSASGSKPDYKKAIAFHTQALQIADPLLTDPHPAIRLAAKEVLVDAHLGAAHDIAWGDWKEKNKAVARWLERAVAVANDLAGNEGGSQEQLLRVYIRSMAAYVGVRGGIDPGPNVRAMISTGDALIAAAGDPIHKAQLQSEMGLALYDAVQIYQMRSEKDDAMKCGEQAAGYLTKANEAKPSPSSSYLLGRLYFRLGAIRAAGDHADAVRWYDKAIPLLEQPSTEDLAADLGRHGESFVTMGVSYWESGRQKKAVALSEKGIELMEQAVKQGTLDSTALAIPYNNLSAMHRTLGAAEKASRYQEMASKAKKEKLK